MLRSNQVLRNSTSSLLQLGNIFESPTSTVSSSYTLQFLHCQDFVMSGSNLSGYSDTTYTCYIEASKSINKFHKTSAW